MLIGSYDTLQDPDVMLLDRKIETAEIVNVDDWPTSSLDPIQHRQLTRYKQIYCELFLECADDNIAYAKISEISSEARKATLKFEDTDFYYDAILDNVDEERITEGSFFLRLYWKAPSAYKPEIAEVASRVPSKTINAPGTLQTLAIVEITPSVNLIDVTITGLGEPFTIFSLTAGQKVIINGEDGTVTENGENKYPDYDSWGFPVLQPGQNEIAISQTSADVTIRFKPRWL